MPSLHTLTAYLKYLLGAGNAHGLHSPLFYKLYTEVISTDPHYYVFEEIEAIRAELLANQTIINFTDFGAGAERDGTRKLSIAHMAAASAKAPRLARLLFRLTEFQQPDTIIDLGTSLGLSTLYLAAPKPSAQVITFEGCPETARLAGINFAKAGCRNIKQVTGNLDQTLHPALSSVPRVDLAFLDANHRLEPTLNYFNLLAKKAHEGSMFILDDIHWSRGMEQAWEQIKAHPSVSDTADLFYLGLVFFRKKQKEHFVLKF